MRPEAAHDLGGALVDEGMNRDPPVGSDGNGPGLRRAGVAQPGHGPLGIGHPPLPGEIEVDRARGAPRVGQPPRFGAGRIALRAGQRPSPRVPLGRGPVPRFTDGTEREALDVKRGFEDRLPVGTGEADRHAARRALGREGERRHPASNAPEPAHPRAIPRRSVKGREVSHRHLLAPAAAPSDRPPVVGEGHGEDLVGHRQRGGPLPGGDLPDLEPALLPHRGGPTHNPGAIRRHGERTGGGRELDDGRRGGGGVEIVDEEPTGEIGGGEEPPIRAGGHREDDAEMVGGDALRLPRPERIVEIEMPDLDIFPRRRNEHRQGDARSLHGRQRARRRSGTERRGPHLPVTVPFGRGQFAPSPGPVALPGEGLTIEILGEAPGAVRRETQGSDGLAMPLPITAAEDGREGAVGGIDEQNLAGAPHQAAAGEGHERRLSRRRSERLDDSARPPSELPAEIPLEDPAAADVTGQRPRGAVGRPQARRLDPPNERFLVAPGGDQPLSPGGESQRPDLGGVAGAIEPQHRLRQLAGDIGLPHSSDEHDRRQTRYREHPRAALPRR